MKATRSSGLIASFRAGAWLPQSLLWDRHCSTPQVWNRSAASSQNSLHFLFAVDVTPDFAGQPGVRAYYYCVLTRSRAAGRPISFGSPFRKLLRLLSTPTVFSGNFPRWACFRVNSPAAFLSRLVSSRTTVGLLRLDLENVPVRNAYGVVTSLPVRPR